MELLYPKAAYLPGPAWKQGYAGISKRQGKGAMYHSAEGELAGMLAVLDSTKQASWQLSLLKTGTWLQHYLLDAVCWHGGCVFANANFVGVECEGRAGEPLTEAQVSALAEFTAWQADNEDWPSIKRRETLWEHWEMVEYGAPATACPSGRIPWQEVIDLATEEIEALKVQFALRQLAEDMRNGLIADLLSGRYRVMLGAGLKRILLLPDGRQVEI